MTTAEKIRVMQAYEDGKEIEFMVDSHYGCWHTAIKELDGELSWDWFNNKYRIKNEK